jgi:hypothetical protein
LDLNVTSLIRSLILCFIGDLLIQVWLYWPVQLSILFLVVMSVTISAWKRCSLRIYLHVLFTLFVFVYVKWCPTHIVLRYCFARLRLLYPMLSVSLDYPFVIAPSVFSNVYLWCNTQNTQDWAIETLQKIYNIMW